MKKFYRHQDALIDGPYRYLLSRVWAEDGEKAKTVTFVMLNPSSADANIDDPTVNRCVSFAERWDFNSLYIVNLFAYRTPYPAKLLKVKNPVGPGNLQTIAMAAQMSDTIICAWGDIVKKNTLRWHLGHIKKVRGILEPQIPKCLGTTKSGAPKHPLYLPKDTEPVDFIFDFWKAMGVVGDG